MNKKDLNQISQLLDQKLEEKLESKLNQKLKPIHKTLEEHTGLLRSHEKILKSHGKVLKSLKKDQGIMLNMLDREQMDQRKRLKRVGEHLGFSPTIL